MKQTALAIPMLFLFSFVVKSQNYVPFPTENVNWNVYYRGTCNEMEPVDTILLRYALHGDTTINDVVYNKLCLESGDTANPIIQPIGGIREEDRKIYYRGQDILGGSQEEELLLYDFTVQIGDTIKHDSYGVFHSVVLDVDSIIINGNYRKQFEVKLSGFYHSPDFVVEGIGSIKNGLIGHISDIPTCGSHYWEHVCFKENGIVKYLNPSFDGCFPANLLKDVYEQNEFAPIGAEWFYDEQFTFSGDVDYIKFTSEKDTLVNGKMCRKITKRHKLICNDRPETEFLYPSNDTVYFFDTIFNEFQILYVFDANAGDSWFIKVKDEILGLDSFEIYVDSVSSLQVNEKKLKVLYVTYYGNDVDLPEGFSSTIIEKIGDVQYMFNWYPRSYVCDANYTRGLRCYKDIDIGQYSTGIRGSCDYTHVWTDIGKRNFNDKIKIYPNPTKKYLEINCETVSEYKVEIYDIKGKFLLSTKFFNSIEILDVSNLEAGYYVVVIRDAQGILGYRKLIKI